MPNDARNKLRNMGGIMASYPELMQAATQRYQAGGPVMAPPAIPRVDPVTVPGTSFPVVGLGRVGPMPPQQPMAGIASMVAPRETPGARRAAGTGGITMQDWRQMSRAERKAAGFPVSELGAQVFFDRFGVGMGLVEPDARYTADGPVEDVVADLMDSSSAGRLDTTDDARAARGFGRSAYLSGLAGNVVNIPQDTRPVSTAREDKEAVLGEKKAELAALEESRPVPDVATSSADRRKEERLRETITRLEGDVAKDADVQARKEEQVMSMPLQPKPLTQEQIDKANELARKDPNFTFPAADEEGPVEDAATDTGTGTGGTGGAGGPAPAPSKKDLRSRYEEKIALFKEIYGEDDEERARDKAMSLAMMGLAIAAGQSPDALTNIARGAAVGLQGMSEQEKARRDRETGLQTLALETAISEGEAEAAAAASAREAALERQNRLEVAAVRAAGGGTNTYTPERARQMALQNILANPGDFPVFTDNVFDPAKARALADQIASGTVDSAAVQAVIEQQRTAGVPDAQIREQLVEEGFNPAQFGL